MAELSDELMQKLLSAAAGLSEPRIDPLIAEAQAQAEAEVKGLIRSAFTAALLRGATRRLEVQGPSSTSRASRQKLAASPVDGARDRGDEASDGTDGAGVVVAATGTGTYVYGIVSSNHPIVANGVTVDGIAPVVSVGHGSLAAIVSRVSLDEFGGSAINDRLCDPAWLDRRVRAHERVLDAAMSAGPVVPFRFATVLRDDRDVARVLEAHHERVAELLTTLNDKREWGVKIYFDDRQNGDARSGVQEGTSGRDYLARKHRDLQSRSRVADRARLRADEAHGALAALSEDAVILPLRGPATGREEGILLKSAYLVAAENEPRFHTAVAALDEQLRSDGLVCEENGPWPAYNFVNLDLSLARTTI